MTGQAGKRLPAGVDKTVPSSWENYLEANMRDVIDGHGKTGARIEAMIAPASAMADCGQEVQLS